MIVKKGWARRVENWRQLGYESRMKPASTGLCGGPVTAQKFGAISGLRYDLAVEDGYMLMGH